MYKSILSGWDTTINNLHSKYSDSQDITFTNYISEKLSDLQDIKPAYVIIVIEPVDADPDFFDDVDSTICQIDADEFADAVWTVITGFTSTDADNLVNASNASDDHTLIIANPDGSLPSSGYAGSYLESIILNDDTYLGDSTHYISNDTDSTASNLQSEINNDRKNCILFLNHGNTNIWGLKNGHYFYGDTQNLVTYDGSSFYEVNNNKNSFVHAGACLTSRISGKRDVNWSPWESVSSNCTGSTSDSIALSWLEDSPGYYTSNNSVSYGNGHIMTVLLNMMKFGYTPAEAVKISKNLYHYIIGDETLDTDPSDGTADDYLLYLEREFMGIGTPSWNIDIAGSPPDYTINYSAQTQQDQLPGNDRGYLYVDNDVKWLCNINLSFNQEIEVINGADEDNSPFTYFFVKEVGGYGGYVQGYECAVIGGIFKPTLDTKSIEYVVSSPSDSDWYLYEHPWYGSGTTEAYEIFKCKINTDEIVWLVGAGLTNYDSNDTYEWRINDGFSKSFDVYYYIPRVTQSVGSAEDLGGGNWRIPITLENESVSHSVEYVIAKVPLPPEAVNLGVVPSLGTSNIIHITEGENYYCEFTVGSMSASEVKEVYVTYSIQMLSITVNPTTGWNIGPKPLGSVHESETFTATNNGNVAEDFKIKGTDGAGGWAIGTSSGLDTFKVEVDKNDGGGYGLTLDKTNQALFSDVAVNGSKVFGLRYSTPTGDTKGAGIAQDFSIVITASKVP